MAASTQRSHKIHASHWASRAELTADSAPPAAAPRAGGAVLKPPAPAWEWELRTSVRAVASTPSPKTDIVCHRGGCHCGAVRFEVDAPSSLVAWECNCSNCRLRRNVHVVVNDSALRLVTDGSHGKGGASVLAEYRYGTGTARHLFCSRCGITPFYKPRSNPDGWGITLQCIDGGTISSVEIRQFDGLNWESCIEGSGSAIKAFSKPIPAAPPTHAGQAPEVATPDSAEPATQPDSSMLRVLLSDYAWAVMPATMAAGVGLSALNSSPSFLAAWLTVLVTGMLLNV